MVETDAIVAADQYRRATELQKRAREEFVAAVIRDRAVVHLSGLAERAGIHNKTLWTWVNRGVSIDNGRVPTSA